VAKLVLNPGPAMGVVADASEKAGGQIERHTMREGLLGYLERGDESRERGIDFTAVGVKGIEEKGRLEGSNKMLFEGGVNLKKQNTEIEGSTRRKQKDVPASTRGKKGPAPHKKSYKKHSPE